MKNNDTTFHILVMLAIFIGLPLTFYIEQELTFDQSAAKYTQDYLNQTLQNRNNKKLKQIVPNKALRKKLVKAKKVTVGFTSFNVVQNNTTSYGATVKPLRTICLAKLKIKNELFHKFKLLEVKSFAK